MGALAGRRIVVTRRPGQSGTLVQLLEARGATVVELPAIEILPAPDPESLDRALRSLEQYRWAVFTSANAVSAVRDRMDALGLEPRLAGGGLELASIGPATTEALRAAFPHDEITIEPAGAFRAAGLLEAFPDDLRAARVLLPCSSRGRDELRDGLTARGAQVDAVLAYVTAEPPGLRERLERCFAAGFDLVAFASPSAVAAFAAAAGEQARGVPVVAIGPTTAEAAREAGLDVRQVASPSSAEGLADAAEAALLTASH